LIVAHLSELHLGFRAYERAERGRNVREKDVAVAFARAVEGVVELGPDLVVIAGDVFDRADPSPAALLALTRGVWSLRSRLPEAPVVLVAGARDTPLLPGDAGALSVMEAVPGVHTASRAARSLDVEELDLHLCLLPYRAGVREPWPELRPDPERRWNVLVGFGTVAEGGVGLRLRREGWDYVALGGEHRQREVAPGVAYAGSIERVGSRPWREAAEEKGFVHVCLGEARSTFHPIPIRPVVALAPVRMPPAGPEGLAGRVREVTDEIPAGIEKKIVHLQLRDARPSDLLALRGDLLVGLRRRALHLQLGTAEPWLPALGLDPDDEGGRARPGGVAVRLPDRVERTDPILGEVDVELPPGLIAVTSVTPGLARRMVDVVAAASEEGVAWLDPRRMGLARTLERVEATLARSVGAEAEGTDGDLGVGGALRAEASGDDPGVARIERELRELRADHAEVVGEVEVATMEWLRERQDAETNLHAYRDRARELRAHLSEVEREGEASHCPTCGRELDDRYAEVRRELEEGWEAVVQDGQWWRRRREQLDLKPPRLQELESRALRLLAALEACGEKLEVARVRADARARGEDRPTPADAEGEAGSSARTDVTSAEIEARRRVRREVLERASDFVCRITGSRVLAVVWTEEGPVLEGPLETVPPEGDPDHVAGEVALRLAGAVSSTTRSPVGGDLLLPEDLVEGLRDDDRLHLLDLLMDVREKLHRVIVPLRPESAERRPEAIDRVLEVRESTRGAVTRWLPAGRARIVLA